MPLGRAPVMLLDAWVQEAGPLGKWRSIRPGREEDVCRFGTRFLGFRIVPEFMSRAFSAAMRFSNSDAGSSMGFCSTNFPRTARSSTNQRRWLTASGASDTRSYRTSRHSEFIRRAVPTRRAVPGRFGAVLVGHSRRNPRRGRGSRRHSHGSAGFGSRQPRAMEEFVRRFRVSPDAGGSVPRR